MRMRKVLENPAFWGAVLAALLQTLGTVAAALIGRH